MRLGVVSACPDVGRSPVLSPHCRNGMVLHVSNPSQGETGGSEVQGHRELHGELEAILPYKRPCFPPLPLKRQGIQSQVLFNGCLTWVGPNVIEERIWLTSVFIWCSLKMGGVSQPIHKWSGPENTSAWFYSKVFRVKNQDQQGVEAHTWKASTGEGKEGRFPQVEEPACL